MLMRARDPEGSLRGCFSDFLRGERRTVSAYMMLHLPCAHNSHSPVSRASESSLVLWKNTMRGRGARKYQSTGQERCVTSVESQSSGYTVNVGSFISCLRDPLREASYKMGLAAGP